MVPLQVAAANQRGSALLEAIPVIGVILVFVTGLLLAGYLIFARQWLQYQGEQGLYCLASLDSIFLCRKKVQAQLTRFLPWTEQCELRMQNSLRSGERQWRIDIQWKYAGVNLNSRKQMSVEQILRNKDLHW